MFFLSANISDFSIDRYAQSRHKYIHLNQKPIIYIFGESVYNLLSHKNGIWAVRIYI